MSSFYTTVAKTVSTSLTSSYSLYVKLIVADDPGNIG